MIFWVIINDFMIAEQTAMIKKWLYMDSNNNNYYAHNFNDFFFLIMVD